MTNCVLIRYKYCYKFFSPGLNAHICTCPLLLQNRGQRKQNCRFSCNMVVWSQLETVKKSFMSSGPVIENWYCTILYFICVADALLMCSLLCQCNQQVAATEQEHSLWSHFTDKSTPVDNTKKTWLYLYRDVKKRVVMVLQKAEQIKITPFSTVLSDDHSVSLRLRDAAAVWLMHTEVHWAGKCCSETATKTKDELFTVFYPLIWAHLGAKSQYWDFVRREYLYANSGHYASRYCTVRQNHDDCLPRPTLNPDWHNAWGLNEISTQLTEGCAVWSSMKLKAVLNLQQ